MAEPTLQDVFGANAAQTATTLTITKADLASTGLDPTSSNTAESLIVALLIKASTALTEAQRATDVTLRQVTLTYAGQDAINQAGIQYQRDAWTAIAYKNSPAAPVDPEDY